MAAAIAAAAAPPASHHHHHVVVDDMSGGPPPPPVALEVTADSSFLGLFQSPSLPEPRIISCCSQEASNHNSFFTWSDFAAVTSYDDNANYYYDTTAENDTCDLTSWKTTSLKQEEEERDLALTVRKPFPPAELSEPQVNTSSPRHDNYRISSASRNNQKQVSFSNTLEIRSFPSIITTRSHHHNGMALECDWKFESTVRQQLDLFESASFKRRLGALRLTAEQRCDRLQFATGLSTTQLLQQEYDLLLINNNNKEVAPSSTCDGGALANRSSAGNHATFV